MRGKKTDIQTKAKIVTEKLTNPDLSTRDIADKIGWIDNTTVNDILNNIIPQLPTDSQRICRIIENDMEAVENMSFIAKRFTKQIREQEELDRGDIQVANTTVSDSFKRSQIFKGNSTDIVTVKESISEEQAKKIALLYANS